MHPTISVQPDAALQARFQVFWAVGAFRWRLLGANNRECGRSAKTFPTVQEALQDADDVRLLVGSGSLAGEFTSSRGTEWVWRLCDQTSPRAQSLRRYGRRTECERGLARFVELAPAAGVSTTVLVGRQVTHSGRL